MDFTNVVLAADLDVDHLAGSMGVVNPAGRPFGTGTAGRADGGALGLDLSWQFGRDAGAFTGWFFNLGPSSKDQSGAGVVRTIDLDNVDGALTEPGGPRSFRSIDVSFAYRGPQPLTLRIEIKDGAGGGRYTRLSLRPADGEQALSWAFRDATRYDVLSGRDLDAHSAATVALVVEHSSGTRGAGNPSEGSLRIGGLWFVLDRPDAAPESDDALLDLVARRACGYFVSRASRDPRSLGFPQDRSDTPDLLTTGGVGYALGAMVSCAERGWLPRELVLRSAGAVLRTLGDPNGYGNEPTGRLGRKGWLYHFLGPDARRSGTSEVSAIDTGIALVGVLAVQGWVSTERPQEAEIGRLAQVVFDRVDFDAMVDPANRRFYLAWSPTQTEGFQIPDGEGGYYSGQPGAPVVIDEYTDEGLLLSLLSQGSPTHAVAREAWCSFRHDPDDQGLVRSWPGALFTYTLARGFVDTAALPACSDSRIDWYQNSRRAILSTIDWATRNPDRLPTFGPDAFGISAAANAFRRYVAYGAPPVAVDQNPPRDGTVNYSAMASVVSFGDDLKEVAARGLRAAWARGHWNPLSGLPDAWSDDIAKVRSNGAEGVIRSDGPWIQPALFAIDQGPMVLAIENARSGGRMWRLLASNPNIARAANRLGPTPPSTTSTSSTGPPSSSTTSGQGNRNPTTTTSQRAPSSTNPPATGPPATTTATTSPPQPPATGPPATTTATTSPPQPPPRCVSGFLTSPASNSLVGQTVNVRARLTPAGGQGTCASAGVDAKVLVVDRGTSYPWALYCTFESCTRDGVLLGTMASDAGQKYGLTLTVDGVQVSSVSVTRST